MLRRWSAFISLILLVVASPAVRAQERLKTCAVLTDSSRPASTLAALVEAGIQQDGKLQLVDRERIKQVIAEKKLIAALGAEAVGERAAMGRLLRADLLIILRRTATEKSDLLEYTVCETKMGLRLASDAAPAGDIEAIAKTIAGLVQNARSIKFDDVAIFAVPPLVCNDLNVTFAPLSAAYATIIENDIERHGGTIVVELAEAKAIADEIALANGVNAKRPLPFYLEGGYRTTPLPDGKRRLLFSLTLRQGKETVDVVEKKDVAGTDEADALRSATDELLAKTNAAHAAPSTQPADDEAAILAARSTVFRKLGNWPEALQMAEASLLIKPNQWLIHRHAIYIISQWLKNPNGFSQQLTYEQRADLFRLGLSHLEAHASNTVAGRADRVSPTEMDSSAIREFIDCKRSLDRRRDPKTGTVTNMAWVNEAMLDTVRRILAVKNQQKMMDRTVEFIGRGVDWMEGTGDLGHGFDVKVAIMQQYPNVFRCNGDLERFIAGEGQKPYATDTSELRRAIVAIDKMPEERFHIAAAKMTRRLNEGGNPCYDRNPTTNSSTQPTTRYTSELAAIPTDGFIRTTPLKLVIDGHKPAVAPGEMSIVGWIPVGDDMEALWTERDLYLMKEAGHLRWVSAIGATGVCYDGKYLWANAPGATLTMLAIDPKTLVIKELSVPQSAAPISEGSVSFASRVLIAAVAPGRICLAGSFGRGWIGTMTYDQSKDKADFNIFFEATRQPEEANAYEWDKKELAFMPLYMIRMATPLKPPATQPSVRILLGREGGHSFNTFHPLLIDADAETVDVVKDDVRVHPNFPRLYNDGEFVYWVDLNDNGGPKLFRLNSLTGRRQIMGRPPCTGSIGRTTDGFIVDSSLSYNIRKWGVCRDMSGPYYTMDVKSPGGFGTQMFFSKFHGAVLSGPLAHGVYLLQHDLLPAPTTFPTTAPSQGN